MGTSSGSADQIILLKRKRTNLVSPLRQYTSCLDSRRSVEKSFAPSYKWMLETWEAP